MSQRRQLQCRKRHIFPGNEVKNFVESFIVFRNHKCFFFIANPSFRVISYRRTTELIEDMV